MTLLDTLIRQELVSGGAACVGYGDLGQVPAEARYDLPRGVSIAVALDPAIVAGIGDGPTWSYEAEYRRVNTLLGELAARAAETLLSYGYRAFALSSTVAGSDPLSYHIPLPHKTVATRAGLGWIGKCALLVTEPYGSAVRLTSVLTDAPLAVSAPVDESRCGACDACVRACPARAVSGRNWRLGAPREEIYNARACCDQASALAYQAGLEEVICGICVAACPWTKRYLRSRGVL